MPQPIAILVKTLVSRFPLLLALVLLCCWPLLVDAQGQTLSERDLKRLERDIASLQKEIAHRRSEQSALQRQLKRSDTSIGQLERRIGDGQQQRQALERELARLDQRRTELQAARDEQQRLVAATLRSSYQLGQTHSLKIVLNQQDPSQLARLMVYAHYVNRARLAQIDRFSQTLTELSVVEADSLQHTATLQRTLQALADQKTELEHQQQARRLALRQLAQEISSKGARLKQQRKDRDDLEKLLLTVADVTADLAASDQAKAFPARKGKMAWPTQGKRLNRFGSRRSQGGLKWQGIEIQAPLGEPVRAIHRGRVMFADWFRGQGLMIIIDHGDAYLSLYSHNQSLLRATGDWVKVGEAIATVGSSGGRNNSALYFEIRHRGKASDPSQWCQP